MTGTNSRLRIAIGRLVWRFFKPWIIAAYERDMKKSREIDEALARAGEIGDRS